MELWKFRYTDAFGKRCTTSHHLTEAEAIDRYGPDIEKVEGSRIDPVPVGAIDPLNHTRK
jgi:hypothetical protein